MKALLISNNERFQKLVHSLLARKNVSVFSLNSNGSEKAIESIMNIDPFTYILIDTTVPNVLSICKKLIDVYKETKIILFTQYGQTLEEIYEYYKNGIHYILEKPFFPEQLYILMDLITEENRQVVSV